MRLDITQHAESRFWKDNVVYITTASVLNITIELLSSDGAYIFYNPMVQKSIKLGYAKGVKFYSMFQGQLQNLQIISVD